MGHRIITIPREAGDTSKGFTLQKLRTISLILSEIKKNESVDFLAAIEYNGDVYLNTERIIYVEENKAYDSKNFSFASSQVKNTFVSFLDYWLNNSRNEKIKFGFYSTNDIARENNTGKVKELAIELPNEPIIKLLINKDYTRPNLISAAKALILDEYRKQYEENCNYKLDESHYSTIEKFTDSDWIDLFNIVAWNFDGDNIDVLEDKVLSQINNMNFPTIPTLAGKERFIRAELFYQLELRQTKRNIADRFIDKNFVELTFQRVINSGINDESYKFLFLDYEDLLTKTKLFLEQFIHDKYFAITGLRKDIVFLNRKVALFDPTIKIHPKRTEFYDREKEYSIEGNFESLVDSEKPIFLLGELGSGKSTIVARYLLSIIEKETGEIPVFIPTSYLQNKELKTIENLITEINRYVNHELPLIDKFFDLNIALKTEKEILLVIDGLDELPFSQAKYLLTNIKRLKESNSKLRVIVTGRPIELESAIPTGWQCLVNIPLKDDEIKKILYNESINQGIPEPDCKKDTEIRFNYLKSRNELYSIAKTPIVLCTVWSDLNESIQNKTLGDLLYNVLKRRLDWHIEDQKGMDASHFLDAYPTVYQREELLRLLAQEIILSREKSVSDERINQIYTQAMGNIDNKNQVVADAVYFFKNTFLQKTTNEKYGFISAPLLECAYGLTLCEDLKNSENKINFIQHWRSLSLAMAIVRSKGIINEIKEHLSNILETNLSWPNNNIASIAIIITELKDAEFADRFVDIISTLEYRPFRTLEQNDRLSIYSIAYCIHLAGEKGFNWFFEEYLSSKVPLIHYQAELASNIIQQYFVIRNFEISPSQVSKLESIIKPNIKFSTSLCYELLPCLSLIVSNGFSIEQRCLLLADLLNQESISTKAQILLKEIYIQNPDYVLNALETVCQKQEFSNTPDAAILWFELNQNRPNSTNILFTCIKSINPQNFEEIYALLTKYIPAQNLLSFLRFCVVSNNEIAGPASLILFWKGEKDFELLSDSLINSINWLDNKNYLKIDTLIEIIRSNKESALRVLIKTMPITNQLGIPPAYWRLFINALAESNKEQPIEFMNAVSGLSKFILTRYPDIRINLRALLTDKPIYRDSLREAMLGMDTGLRNKSASILLVSFPETEALALEKIILGFISSLGDGEWQSFILGLNYSNKILTHIHSILSKLVEGPKTFALALLYHHKYPLSQNQTDELIKGLLGEGYFFDNPGIKISESPSGILSQNIFFEKIVPNLYKEELVTAQKASSVLMSYHFDKLELKQKAIVWLLQVEYYERYFFEFTLNNMDLLSQDDFKNNLLEFSKHYIEQKKKLPLLLILLRIENGELNWNELLIRFIEKSENFDNGIMEELFQWLISFCRKYPEKRANISKALNEILSIPIYKENNGNNDIYPIISLIALEFEAIESTEIIPILKSYRVSVFTEEVFCAIALRSNYYFEDVDTSYVKKAYITLFTEYRPAFFKEISEKELKNLFVEGEDIPDEFISTTEQILLQGLFSGDTSIKLSEKGNLASYFAILINFCRKESIQIEKLLAARKIGGTKYYQIGKTISHRNILKKIYRSFFSEEENRKIYIEELKSELTNPNNDNFIANYYELISAGEYIDFIYFKRLLDILLQRPYLLKENIAKELSLYIGNKIEEKDFGIYIEEIEKALSAMNNYYDKEGHEGQYNLMMWLFSLAFMYLSKKTNETSQTSFLLGLRYIYLEKNGMGNYLRNQPEIIFKADDLYRCTYPLYSKIGLEVIKQMLEYGIKCNIPEVSACCRTLAALAGTSNKYK